MTQAEHKLYLFRQIDQMPEELLLELEIFIANLWDKKPIESKQTNDSLMPLENFLTPRIKAAEQGNVINKSVLEIFNEIHREDV